MAHDYHQGKYSPRYPEKYVGDRTQIIWRSSWERRFMVWCDNHPAVVAWTSEYPIPYYSQVDGKMRRYFVDFFVKIRGQDGREKTLMVEIKPDEQTRAPARPKKNDPRRMARYLAECETFQINTDKWDAARDFAQKNGFEFHIFTEYDLGVKKRGK